MAKFIIKYFIFALVCAVIRTKAETDKSVSKNEETEKKKTSSEEPLSRRYLDDLNDIQWYVAHLKESDFDDSKDGRRSGCKEESFQEKLIKYRRSLKRDPGRIEYVSADALPFNPEDLREETCQIEDNANFQTNYSKDMKTENGTTTNEIKNVTVTNSTEHKAGQNDSDTRTPIFKNDTRKSNDYLVSSAEYYDDVVEFDKNLCPDVVDVVELEQDLIRNYDVGCELTIKWKSLE